MRSNIKRKASISSTSADITFTRRMEMPQMRKSSSELRRHLRLRTDKTLLKNMYSLLWTLGEMSGCHQRADRSFFIKGKQFPVCARCTGAFIGYSLGAIVFLFYQIPWWISLLLWFVMFADWLLQRINILQSTNTRRVITGTLCGFGLIQLYLGFISFICKLINHII